MSPCNHLYELSVENSIKKGKKQQKSSLNLHISVNVTVLEDCFMQNSLITTPTDNRAKLVKILKLKFSHHRHPLITQTVAKSKSDRLEIGYRFVEDETFVS